MVDRECPHFMPKVLPLVYEDSLSYNEQVMRLLQKVNECIDYVNEINEKYTEEAKAYTDARFDEVKGEFDRYEREINAIVATFDGKYESFVAEVRAQLQLMRADIAHFDDVIRSDIAQVNARTDTAIQQNNEYLLAEIGKGIINVKVLNYFTGAYVTIQEMFDYLAGFHLENAITFNQLISRDKTYNELIAYNMSYTDLAVNGGTIIQ